MPIILHATQSRKHSRQNLFHYFAMYVGEAEVAALKAVDELLVV